MRIKSQLQWGAESSHNTEQFGNKWQKKFSVKYKVMPKGEKNPHSNYTSAALNKS